MNKAKQALRVEAQTGEKRRGPAWQAELKRLARKHGGLLDPEVVVAAAADPRSPLHSRFQWDNTKAAHQYRLWQAQALIRVAVHVSKRDGHVDRVWVSLKQDRGEGGYRPLVSVLRDEELTSMLLDEAKADWEIFARKYRRLVRLADLIQAGEDVFG